MQAQIAAARAKPVGKREVTIVIFGRDSKKKGHAASFVAAEADAALRAAKLMGLAVWRVPGGGQALAARVPKGRLFGSGRAFTPLINAKLMAELELTAGPAAAATPAPATEAPAGGSKSSPDGETEPGGGRGSGAGGNPACDSLKRPTDWGSIGPACLVLATSGTPADGWYECEVVSQRDTDLFELRWIDWPTEPLIVRRRDNLGLLPPSPVG